jgi:AraC family transcriptional regulator, exoenzyme S synthesis regulatory protein ExsA
MQNPMETLGGRHMFAAPFAMLNIFEALRDYPGVRRFHIGDLLFAEVTCPVADGWSSQWAHVDHLVHVLTGRKTLRACNEQWVARPGDTFFIKKGAYLSHFDQDSDMCLLVFFIPDEFVREVVKEVMKRDRVAVESQEGRRASMIRVNNDMTLQAFLQAMGVFFAGKEDPPELVLRLKLKELIASILVSAQNRELAAYFQRVATLTMPSIPAIMEQNYCHNLPLEAFARMCHRSVSSFKRDFCQIYGTSPGRWLLERRLERAAHLLRSTAMSITEIVFECGFESASHFCRAFKGKFGLSPGVFRGQVSSGVRQRPPASAPARV